MKAEEQAATALANAIASLARAMDAALPAEAKRDPEAWLAGQEERFQQVRHAAAVRHEQHAREHERTWRRY